MPRDRRPRRLGAALARVRAEAQPATLLAAVQAAWPRAVGERIAAVAQPTAEREGTITVSCQTAAWAQELDLLHDELLARLREALAAGSSPAGGQTRTAVARGAAVPVAAPVRLRFRVSSGP